MKPVLKWVGGKSQIIDEIISMVPKEINNYHEPFLGCGAVLLTILTLQKEGKLVLNGQAYASDINQNLIYFYLNVQQNVGALICELKKIISMYQSCPVSSESNLTKQVLISDEEKLFSQEIFFYWIRQTFNLLTIEEKSTPYASAMLLFLNKTGFRGMYREGPNGFNVPFGNYKNPKIFQEDHLMSMSQLIKDVIFIHCPFEQTFQRVLPDDFVYFDPPYVPKTATSFVQYTSNGFDGTQHEALFSACQELCNRQVEMLISNSKCDYVLASFPVSKFFIKVISCRRRINSKNPEEMTDEVLITNHQAKYEERL